MKAHVIQNGVIANTIEVDALDVIPGLVDASIGGSIGDSFVDGFVVPKPAQPVPVPQSVTMRQAARALLDADLLDDVEALVATLPRAYQIDWDRASVVERSNPLVEIVRQQKSMTDAQIDDLFIAAATL